MIFRERLYVPGLRNAVLRSKAALWFPGFGAVVNRHHNVLGVLGRRDGKVCIPAHNLVTDAGDLYYAQLGASEATTNAFGVHELASAAASAVPNKSMDRGDFTQIASTEKAHSGSYPTTNDGDADNTGAGTDIVSYLAEYTKGDFNHSAITHGMITNATPGASEPLLTGYAFASSFEKTSDDTLKVFVNHEMLGS